MASPFSEPNRLGLFRAAPAGALAGWVADGYLTSVSGTVRLKLTTRPRGLAR